MKKSTSYGIGGLVEQREKSSSKIDVLLGSSFKDLNGLMDNAEKLIDFAKHLEKKSLTEKEVDEYTKMIHELGIASPVSKDTAGVHYNQKLMQEIDKFCNEYFKTQGQSAILLTDFYSLYNRARGHLVSPTELKNACDLLHIHGKYVDLMQVNRSLIIHDKEFTLNTFKANILHVLQETQKITPFQISQHYGIQYVIVKELMIRLEQNQVLCRDESEEGVSFYENMFKVYALQYLNE
ncbi:Vacuolar protein-sorting-associated protein 36 [Entamoeba marina]